MAPSLAVTGGQSIQAECLKNHLLHYTQAEVVFVSSTPESISSGSLLQRTRYLRTVFNTLSYLYRLLKAIRKGGVIHIFTAAYYQLILVSAPALILAKLWRRPAILHYHDGRAQDHLQNWPLSRHLLKLPLAIVVPSGFLTEVFQKFGFSTLCVSNILETPQIPFRKRRILSPRFLHNRGMESVYNVECTIRAFHIIQQHYPEASLTLAHDGPLRGSLQRLVEELRLRNVVFTGALPHEEMLKLYNEADIYLSSADADNMPGSILESFAAGLPVVATSAGGTPWILTDKVNGLSVPCGDYQAMAAAALKLLENPEFALKLATHASEGLSQYNGDLIGLQWLRIYQQIASAGPVTPAFAPEFTVR